MPTETASTLAGPVVFLDPRTFDPGAVWYGPHECPNGCKQMVVVMGQRHHGGVALNQPNEPIYPNTHWTVHHCLQPNGLPPSVQAAA